MNQDKFMKIGIGIVIGAVGFQILSPKKPTRRTSKEIALLKNKAEQKGYFEGYADAKKDFKVGKKKKKKR